MCKKQCEMREIHVQKQCKMREIHMLKNSAKCVKFMCKKQCKMRQINMQKTVRNAWNSCAKNKCKMRQIHVQKTVRKAWNSLRISHCFLHRNLAHFQRFFFRKICKKLYDNFLYFSSFFMMIFYGTVCRDGKGGIPVKSRCKCGNPDRNCTGNTRFCSAMSTKSEIVKVMPWKRLTSCFNRNQWVN